MKYLMGIDFGTGGAKVSLTDCELNQVAYSYQEYPILTPALDFSEHDPELYWQATCKNIHSCIAQAGISNRDIAAVALSAAMPSMVVTDKDGKALGNAINLLDKRAKQQVSQVIATIGMERYFAVTANRLEDHPSIVNLLWLKEHDPERYARIAHVHSIDGYVSFRMTGVHNVNRSNAMFFGAYDIQADRFDEDMLLSLGLDPAVFPPITECTDVIGEVLPDVAEETGLAPGTPVLSGQTDCNAGWLGAGATRPGDVQMNLGTCGNFGVIMTTKDFLPSMINFPYTIPGTYICVPTSSTGGVLVRYMRDSFGDLERAAAAATHQDVYDLLNYEAERIPAGSGGLVVLPYLMGERTPIWDANAKGTIFGLSLRHTKAHVIRAMMEAAAYALYHSYELLYPYMQVKPERIILNEGGAKSALWRRIITDVFNVPTAMVKNRAGAPYGDCLLAGVGIGLIPSFDVAREKAQYIEAAEPDPATHAIYMDYFSIYKELYPRLKDLFAKLAEVNEKYQATSTEKE